MRNKEIISCKKMIEYIDKARRYIGEYTFEELQDRRQGKSRAQMKN